MTDQTPVWFITAAASGFGKAMALEALSRGHKVIASGRYMSRLVDLETAGADIMVLEVCSPLSDIETVAEEANAKYGYITHLVNVAGYVLVGAVEETSPEQDLRAFTTNVLGTLNVTKAFLPHLRATPGHRTISNFGSVVSWQGGPGSAIYVGTKWAVSGISESLRAELAPFGINVMVIEPGWFRTGILGKGVPVYSEKSLGVYEDVGRLREMLGEVDGKQVGDTGKACRVAVDVLTRCGCGEGKDVPIRLVLGRDAFEVIGEKCRATLRLLGEWEGVVGDTDYD
ncbi:Short-chain alcohol dehydrogenase [Pyrenophora tritici-repentis]|nr:Short-chain alcohol dehydrogenase [Pyrenophora tritici-repentis]